MATRVHFIGKTIPITIDFGEPTSSFTDGTIKTKTHLFADDTILTIKQKILEELQEVLPKDKGPYYSNDLYLFATVYRENRTPEDWVQYIQRQEPTRRQTAFKQILSNLGYSKNNIEQTQVSIPEDILAETLNPWLKNQIRIPLGIRPTKTHVSNADFFAVHPFESYLENTGVEWASHQNETLLEYGELIGSEIYACLYEDIPEENRANYGMTNRAVKTTQQAIINWGKMDNQQAVYEWYQTSGSDRTKTAGITHLELEWTHPKYTVLPLEVIFKNIHANSSVPFIRWKNFIRLYCPTRDERGNKVSQLSKTEIAKIERENQLPHLTLWTEQGIIIHILKNGNLQIHINRKKPTPVEEIQQGILDTAKPIIQQLNQYLQKTGFYYPINWETIFRNDPTVVRFSNICWTMTANLEMETTFQKKQLAHLEPMFVLLAADSEKKVSQANLTYRRVSNYDNLNELKEIIRLETGHKKSMEKIVSELEDRGYSPEKIKLVVQEVMEELQAGKQYFQKKEKKFGCPVLLTQRHNEIQITVENISFLENISLLQSYVEAFIQQVFYKKQLPKDLIFSLSNAPVIEPKEVHETPAVVEETEEEEEEVNGEEENGEEEATGVLLFDDEDENEEATGVLLFNDDEDEEETNDKQAVKDMLQMDIPDVEESPSFMAGGAKKSKASFSILDRLKERDPELFDVPDQNGKVYSRICPGSSSRYPIVLSKEEKKKIDEKDSKLGQSSYGEPLEYKNNTYVCPRYWNFRENRSMSQAEFDKNPTLLENIIQDEKDVNNDANDKYIYEFKKGKRFDKNNRYKEHYPGFSSKNKKGFCLPCCFSEKDKTFQKNIQECKAVPNTQTKNVSTPPDEEEESQEEKITKKGKKQGVPKEKIANANYVLGINIYPLDNKRWGQIYPPIQNVINRSDSQRLLLRYGVERQEKQSFLACLAELLELPVKQTKKLLTTKIINLDRFVQYQSGAVASRFNATATEKETEPDIEKYQETAFYKSQDLENPYELSFLLDTIKTYERFMEYINSNSTTIDTTYLWDVIATPNDDLFSTGLNIVVFEMETNEDTEIHISCPSQLYSNTSFYDNTKPTWFLVKRPLLSGEIYYEPIYEANRKSGARTATIKNKVFLPEEAEEFFPFLTTLNDTMCLSDKDKQQDTSLNPRQMSPQNIFERLRKKFQVKQQVVNLFGETVGFVVDSVPKVVGQYIPCFPSVFLPKNTSSIVEPPVMERIQLNAQLLQKPLKTTAENLQFIGSQTGLPCNIKSLVANYESVPKIIGIQTGYLGYAPVVPEDLKAAAPKYGLSVEYSSDPIEAEMNVNIQNTETGDDLSQKYFLENEFFLAFQGKMRNLLNEYNNENIRREIMKWIRYRQSGETANKVNSNATFLLCYNRVLSLLRKVAEGRIIFNDFDPRVLEKLKSVFECQTDDAQRTESQPYCLLRQGAEGQDDKMVFPKKNLANPSEDNETVYFSKLADALTRNQRIQNIVFQPFKFFNMLGSMDYQINEDEILVG